MKRYIIEERESDSKTCEGCLFEPLSECHNPIAPCLNLMREDRNTIIFSLVKEEEIK